MKHFRMTRKQMLTGLQLYRKFFHFIINDANKLIFHPLSCTPCNKRGRYFSKLPDRCANNSFRSRKNAKVASARFSRRLADLRLFKMLDDSVFCRVAAYYCRVNTFRFAVTPDHAPQGWIYFRFVCFRYSSIMLHRLIRDQQNFPTFSIFYSLFVGNSPTTHNKFVEICLKNVQMYIDLKLLNIFTYHECALVLWMTHNISKIIQAIFILLFYFFINELVE